MMEFWQNIPMLLVVFSLMSAAICSVLPGKVARVWLTAATGLACAASAFFLAKMLGFEEDTPNLYLQQARRILDLDIAGTQQMIRDIWNEKRATILTDDAMYQRFEDFEELLNASGAYPRESERWYGGAQELNLAEIQAFAVEHLHTIDLAIENLWPLDGADTE